MKRKLLLLLVALLAVGQNAFAYDFSYTYQGKTLFYTIEGNGVSVANPLSGNYYSYVSGDVVIPDSVENSGTWYAVTSIGENAFNGCSSLTSVTIGGLVTYIGSYAFEGCSGLTSVTIPNSVTDIGFGAFSGCSGLTLLTIPNSVTFINYAVFSGCSGLTSVIIPNSVISIDQGAFEYCSGLTSLTIPNSVTYISGDAFYNCSNLTSIVVEAGNTHYDSRDNCNAIIQTDLDLLIQGCNSTVIPNTVTAIGNNAFSGCSGLTSVTIPNSVTSIGHGAFYQCSGLTSVIIPNLVSSIGDMAFYRCSGLTSVTIGSLVTSIGYRAFSDCSGLTSVYCEATTPPTLSNSNAFSSTRSCPIYVPCGSVSAYQNATYWSNYASRILGMAILDYTYSFVANNETMGTVSVGDVDCDSNIVVTATANSGYQFTGWSDGGTGNPRTFHLTGDTSVTAVFDYISYAVVGQSSDAARGSVSGSDTVYSGETVTLTATPNYGYHFQRWNDNNQQNPRTVTATANVTYTAYFDPNSYTVTVLSDNEQQGTVGGGGTTAYLVTRTIYATPATGYHFSHWSDGNTSASRTITVEGDTTLTAYFEINSYTLIVLSNDESKGSVTGSGTYTHGTEVTVTATPTAGNRFDHWSDGSLFSSRTVTMTSDLTLTAAFVEVETVVQIDTIYIDNYIHDTTYVDVPYPVHDTIYIDVYVPVHDTTYVNVPYPVHDTTYVNVPYPVHDTTYIAVHDTTVILDTLTLTEYVHDTTVVDNYIYDTTTVYDTLYLTEYVHDTTVVDNYIYDTIVSTEYVYQTDTVVVDNYIYDTIVNTEYIYQTDTVVVDNYIHDTLVLIQTDTLVVDNYITDTLTVTDTIVVDNYVTDTLYLWDTLYLTDTVYIHDTVYVHDSVGVDDVSTVNYTVYATGTQIVVEGDFVGNVALYDLYGRMLAVKRNELGTIRFDVTATGAYLIKVGDHPARKIVVVR